MTGLALLGMGILLFVVGICLMAGVMVSGIAVIGFIAWIPMSVGGILIIVGIVLIIIKRA